MNETNSPEQPDLLEPLSCQRESALCFAGLISAALRDAGTLPPDAQKITQQLCHAIFCHSPLGVSVRTRFGQLVSYNESWKRIWAVPEEDIQADMLRPRTELSFDIRDGYLADWQAAVHRVYTKGGSCYVAEAPTSGRRPGAAEWVAQYFYALPDEQGHVAYVVILTEDITLRKRSEEQLQRMHKAIEHAGEAVLVTDRAGRLDYVNSAFEQLLGYSASELRLFSPDQMQLALGFPAAQDRIQALLEAGQTWRGCTACKRKDGTVLDVQATVSPITVKGKPSCGYVAIIRDITREVLLEAQLLQAQKAEVLGALSSGIAHDFNNLLFTIVCNAEMVLDELPPQSQAADNMDALLGAAMRGKELVRRVMEFSRQSQRQVETVDVSRTVDEVVRMMRPLVAPAHRLGYTIRAHTPYVQADPVELLQVLMNLITNAMQALAQQPGSMEIILDDAQTDADTNPADHPHAGPMLQLSVKDNGPGMAPELLERIFDPFFTTKSSGQGTGLGLPVVQNIVERIGGSLQVISEPGQGSTFTILLPAVAQPAPPPASVARQVHPEHQRVAIVDDEEIITQLLHDLLERMGYRPQVYNAPTMFLEALREDHALCDVLLTDQNMPGMSGLTMLKHIRAIRPDLPAVILTGAYTQVDLSLAKQLGVSEVLLKPVKRDVLAASISKALSAENS